MTNTPKPYSTEWTEHCQLCKSTSYEDLHTGRDGYTACCNEPIVQHQPGMVCYC